MTGRSIKHYLLLSWMLPMLLAVGASAGLSFAISYLDYSNHHQAVEMRLREDAPVIARRIAAELLLKENGRLEAVQRELLSEFKLIHLDISQSSDRETQLTKNSVTIVEQVPGFLPTTFVHISVDGPSFSKFINFRNFLFALIPILGLTLSGFFIQQYLLRRYVIRPIRSLAETSVGARPVKEHWPLEIQKIASELAENFSNREQAVFGQLARGLIHDIRTQINSISTALQLVQESQAKTPENQSRLEKLESACARNVPKVKDLLDLSLDSSREIVLKPRPSDISKTVQQSIQNIQELADAKGVSIVSDAIGSLNVSHDKIQLERVFTNLIKNAVEAVEDRTISNRRVEVSVESTSEEFVIKIEDSGPGFPSSKQIFRPLKTTKAHGHGLGLFVSRKIVQAHQGELAAGVSERLGGAKFTVSLPNKETRI